MLMPMYIPGRCTDCGWWRPSSAILRRGPDTAPWAEASQSTSHGLRMDKISERLTNEPWMNVIFTSERSDYSATWSSSLQIFSKDFFVWIESEIFVRSHFASAPGRSQQTAINFWFMFDNRQNDEITWQKLTNWQRPWNGGGLVCAGFDLDLR